MLRREFFLLTALVTAGGYASLRERQPNVSELGVFFGEYKFSADKFRFRLKPDPRNGDYPLWSLSKIGDLPVSYSLENITIHYPTIVSTGTGDVDFGPWIQIPAEYISASGTPIAKDIFINIGGEQNKNGYTQVSYNPKDIIFMANIGNKYFLYGKELKDFKAGRVTKF